MKVLITGGAGFIGSNLAWDLYNNGYEVTVLDSFSRGRRENLVCGNKKNWCKVIHRNVLEPNLFRYIKGHDYVFHFAGTSSLPENQIDPYDCITNNVAGTANVLEACRQTGVKRVIFASTSAIYEGINHMVVEDLKTDPYLLYSVSKKQAEMLCRSFNKCYGLDITIVRYFNVYGPNQDFLRPNPPLTSYIARELMHDRAPTFHIYKEKLRDYVYVSDINRLNWLCMTQTKSINRVEVYNAADNNPRSVKEIYDAFCKAFDKQLTPNFAPPSELWKNYPELFKGAYPLKKEIVEKETLKHSTGTSYKAFEELGWKPEVTLEEGAKKIAEYVQAHKDS